MNTALAGSATAPVLVEKRRRESFECVVLPVTPMSAKHKRIRKRPGVLARCDTAHDAQRHLVPVPLPLIHDAKHSVTTMKPITQPAAHGGSGGGRTLNLCLR